MVETLGGRIRAARKGAGMTQQDLAVRAGLSVRGVSELEQGGRTDPHYSTLLKIARALSVDAHWLYTGEEQTAPKGGAPSPSLKETGGPGPSREELHAAVSRVLHEHGVYDEEFEEQLADLFRRHASSPSTKEVDPAVEARARAILRQKAKRDEDQRVRRNLRAYLAPQIRELAASPPDTREPVDAVLEQARSFIEPLDSPAEHDIEARLEAEAIELFIARLELMAERIEAGNLAGAKRAAEEAAQKV